MTYQMRRAREEAAERIAHHWSFEVRVTHEHADADLSVALDYAVETSDPVDVDQRLRRRQPEVHRRDEALAPGEHGGGPVLLRERVEGFVDGRGGQVAEPRGLHGLDIL